MATSKNRVPRTVVPGTIEGVGELLTARKWDKAAIVYAWTLPEESGGRPLKSKSGQNLPLLNISDFADMGFAGLTSRLTVRAYRKAWVDAIARGLADPVGPGDEINVDLLFEEDFPLTHSRYGPDADYEAEAESEGVSFAMAKRAGSNKAAVKAAIKADAAVERAAWEAIREKDAARRERANTRIKDRGPIPQGPRPDTVLGAAVRALEGAVEEGSRRDKIHELQKAAAAIKTAAAELVAEHGHTGVPDEVEWLHEVTADLTEAMWALTGFIVETEQEDAR